MNPFEQLLSGFATRRESAFLWAGDAGAETTYGVLESAVADWRRRLRAAGVRPGDVCVVRGSHGLVSTAALLAAAAEDLIVAPLSARTDAEAERRIAAVPARWLVSAAGTLHEIPARDGEVVAAAHPLLERLRATGSPGLILFSSGTTAAPKVVLHDFGRLLEAHRRRGGKPHRVAATLGFDHIGGIDVVLGTLASGGALVVPSALEPTAVAEAVARGRAGALPASPTLLNLMLASGALSRADLGGLRVVAYGAEPMPAPLLERLRAALPWVRFEQRFGTSETGALRTKGGQGGELFFRIEDLDTEWRIVDGELWLRSPRTMLGYLAGPADRLTEDGWFRTGDLVETAQDGSLRIAGRAAEQINVGGEKVLPAEVETHLLRVPGLTACRVTGEPHPLMGSVVVADTVWSEPLDAIEAKRRVRAALAGKLEPHKLPVKVRVVPSIGMTERGKKSAAAG